MVERPARADDRRQRPGASRRPPPTAGASPGRRRRRIRHESVTVLCFRVLIDDGDGALLAGVASLRDLGAWLLDPLAPPRCLSCRALLVRAAVGPGLCDPCATAVARSSPVAFRADAIDGGLAPLAYDGTGRRLVAALKFGRLPVVAELGAALIADRAPAGWLEATVVPVPAAPFRARRRGFDPAWELSSALVGHTGARAEPVLRRRDRRHQRGRSRAERLARPPLVDAVAGAPRRALLIDDVVTTGATIDACARTLRLAGSLEVRALALAAAPPLRAVGDRAPAP